jgi:glycosyltransferase involved in cell wall biosynthesis
MASNGFIRLGKSGMRETSLNGRNLSPLVSVIIPTYNHVRFAVAAVRSAMEQTYSNVEVIVVDDGSTDGSAEAVLTEFPNDVQVIRQENRGPSAAFNAGRAVARGEFVALLGGDDICLPDRISHQVELLTRTGIDAVFCRPIIINNDGNVFDCDVAKVFFRTDISKNISLQQLFFWENFLCAPSATLRADAFARVGAMHEGLIQLQDYELWMRACALGLKLRLYDHPVVQYRRHEGNLSTVNRNLAAVNELPFVLLKTLQHGNQKELRCAFRSILPLAVDESQPLSQFEIALIMLAHPRPNVKGRGMELITELLDDREFMASDVAQRLDMFRFAYNATA